MPNRNRKGKLLVKQSRVALVRNFQCFETLVDQIPDTRDQKSICLPTCFRKTQYRDLIKRNKYAPH